MKRVSNRILIILFFITVAVFGCFRVIDTDVWLYIRTGEYICTRGELPRSDIFSYTAEDAPWINSHWLAQSALYLVHAAGGAVGLSLLRIAVVLALFAVLYAVCRRYASPGITVAVLLLALLTAHDRMLIKPSLFALLGAAVTLYLLDRRERLSGTKLILLVFLQVVWINVHPSFFLLPLVTAVYLFESLLSRAEENRSRRVFLFLALALLPVASLCNPYGFSMLAAPWSQLGGRIFSENLIPWTGASSAFPVSFSWLSFKLMTVLSLGLFIANGRRIRPAHLVLTLLFMYLAITSRRHLALFALFAAPGLARNAACVTERLTDRWRPSSRMIKLVVPAILSAAFLALTWMVFTNEWYYRQRSVRRFGLGRSRLAFPDNAFEFMEKSGMEGRVFCNYDIGSVFAGRFYPARKAFIDGRNLVYGETLFRNYLEAMGDADSFQRLVDNYGVEILLLTHFSRDVKALLPDLWKDDAWKPVYADSKAVLFIRARNAGSFERVEMEECVLNGARSTTRFPLAELRAGEFFFTIGEEECAANYFTEALARDPALPEAHNFLGIAAMKRGDLHSAKREFMKAAGMSRRYAEPRINSAIVFLEEGDHAAAIRAARTAVRLAPGNAKAHGTLGLAYRQAGRLTDARNELQRALELAPEVAEYHNSMGAIHEERGKRRPAIECYEEARARQEDYFAPRFNLGRLYAEQGKRQPAIACYREAARIAPNHTGTRKQLALVLIREGKYEEAICHLEEARRVDPGDRGVALLLNKAYGMR